MKSLNRIISEKHGSFETQVVDVIFTLHNSFNGLMYEWEEHLHQAINQCAPWECTTCQTMQQVLTSILLLLVQHSFIMHHLNNFARGSHNNHSYKVLLNLQTKWFQRRSCLKNVLYNSMYTCDQKVNKVGQFWPQ